MENIEDLRTIEVKPQIAGSSTPNYFAKFHRWYTTKDELGSETVMALIEKEQTGDVKSVFSYQVKFLTKEEEREKLSAATNRGQY